MGMHEWKWGWMGTFTAFEHLLLAFCILFWRCRKPPFSAASFGPLYTTIDTLNRNLDMYPSNSTHHPRKHPLPHRTVAEIKTIMSINHVLSPSTPPVHSSSEPSEPRPMPAKLKGILRRLQPPPKEWTQEPDNDVSWVNEVNGITSEEDEWCQAFGDLVRAELADLKEEEWCQSLLVSMLGNAHRLS